MPKKEEPEQPCRSDHKPLSAMTPEEKQAFFAAKREKAIEQRKERKIEQKARQKAKQKEKRKLQKQMAKEE